MEIKMSESEMHTLIVSMKLDKSSAWETLRFEESKIITVPQGSKHEVIC